MVLHFYWNSILRFPIFGQKKVHWQSSITFLSSIFYLKNWFKDNKSETGCSLTSNFGNSGIVPESWISINDADVRKNSNKQKYTKKQTFTEQTIWKRTVPLFGIVWYLVIYRDFENSGWLVLKPFLKFLVNTPFTDALVWRVFVETNQTYKNHF